MKNSKAVQPPNVLNANLAVIIALMTETDIGAIINCPDHAVYGDGLLCWNGTQFVPVIQKPKATIAALAAINTTLTYVTPSFRIPANTLKVGDTFTIKIAGTCTSTAANVTTWTPRFGAAGTTADAAIGQATSTAAASGTNVAFQMEINVAVRSVGATATLYAYTKLTNSGVTGIANQTNVVVSLALLLSANTTIDNFIGVSLVTAAATTTHTIQSAIVEKN